MRTIKFRAKNNFGATIYLSLDSMAEYFKTLSQFVGFLDKKGHEIYEGDIIKYDYFGDEGELQYSYMQIFWNESTASFCYDDSYKSDKTSGQELNQEFCSDVIIVGNIHQNSDLLAYH